MNQENRLRLLLCLLMMMVTVGASAQSTGDMLFAEGQRLEQQGTIESLEKAVNKYKAAKVVYAQANKKKLCDNQIAVCNRKIKKMKHPPVTATKTSTNDETPTSSSSGVKEECIHNNAERIWCEVYGPTIKKYPKKFKVSTTDRMLDILTDRLPLLNIGKNLYISSQPLPKMFLDNYGLFKVQIPKAGDLLTFTMLLSAYDNLQSEFYLPTKEELISSGLCKKSDMFVRIEASSGEGVISADGKVWTLVCIPAPGEVQPCPESLYLVMRTNQQSIYSSFYFEYIKDDVYASEIVTEDIYRIVCGRNHNIRLPNNTQEPVSFTSVEEAKNFVNEFNSYICSFGNQEYTLRLPTESEIMARRIKNKQDYGDLRVLSSNGQLWLVCERNTYMAPWRVPNVEMPYFRVASRLGARCTKCERLFRVNYFNRYTNREDVKKALH